MKRFNGFAVWQAFLAALGFITSGTMLAQLAPPNVTAGLVLLAGALNAGTATYAQAVRVSSTQTRETG